MASGLKLLFIKEMINQANANRIKTGKSKTVRERHETVPLVHWPYKIYSSILTERETTTNISSISKKVS